MSRVQGREGTGEETEQQWDGEHDEDEPGHVEHGDRWGVVALLDGRGDHHVQPSRRCRQHAPVGSQADRLQKLSDGQSGGDEQPPTEQRSRPYPSQRTDAATVDVRADEDARQAEQGEVDARRNAHTSDGDGHDPSGQHREDDAATDDAPSRGEPGCCLRGDEGHDAHRDAHHRSRSASLGEASPSPRVSPKRCAALRARSRRRSGSGASRGRRSCLRSRRPRQDGPRRRGCEASRSR